MQDSLVNRSPFSAIKRSIGWGRIIQALKQQMSITHNMMNRLSP
jgi:hypothetical protein